MADTSNTRSLPRRVLLVGLDAADPSLLLAATRDGPLRNLADMQANGSWGVVSSPAGFGSGAVWPSVATAVSPARHGRYYYQQLAPCSYEAQRFEDEEFQARPVWEHLSRSGRRVDVFDVPKVGLSRDINGRSVVDWMSHGPVYDGLRTWPEAYSDELTSVYGRDPMPKCDMPGGRDVDEMREFLEVLRSRIVQRERCTIDVWKNDRPDLLVTVFAEPHCVGHQAWHVRDPEHPQFDLAAHEALGDPVMTVYRQIDEAIGRVRAQLDDDTVLVVFSGTGMGPNYTGNNVLDEVLRRLDRTTITRRRASVAFTKKVAKRVLPRELRRRGRPLKRRVEERAAAGDRAKRRAFAVPHNDIAGAVRLNIEGREPQGRLRADEVDGFVASLREELLALRNAETGGPVVDDVVRVADEMAGDFVTHMPDLFVVWNRTSPIDRVVSESVGTVEYRHRGNRTGDHNPESCLFAVGPGVEVGEVVGATIYDVLPTVAAVLGVDVPDTDGRVLPQVASPLAPGRV